MSGGRTRWHLLANAPVVAWLVTFVVVALVHRFVPAAGWLLVHTLLLGAVSSAILVWSGHFAGALLRRPDAARAKGALVRLGLLQVGTVTVATGILVQRPLVIAVGAVLVVTAVLAHAAALVLMLRRSLPARFSVVVRYYVVAALMMLPVAATGALLGRELDDGTAGRVLLAHVAVALLGWVLLTVVGTLLTLWPTMLRTRLPEGAEASARRALPVLTAGVLLTGGAALAAPVRASALGLLAVLAGLAITGVPLVRAALARRPRGYAALSVAAACLWLVGSLFVLVALLATSADVAEANSGSGSRPCPHRGFAGQVLLGSLSFLIPVGRRTVRSAAPSAAGPGRSRPAGAGQRRAAGLRPARAQPGAGDLFPARAGRRDLVPGPARRHGDQRAAA